MNVVMSAFGTLGDVLPFVAVGRELRRRGHEVTLVANAAFERLAADVSINFVPTSPREDHERLLAAVDLWEPSRMPLEKARVQFYYPHMPSHYRGVEECCAAKDAVVVTGELGGMLAAEKMNIPLVYLACTPATSAVTRSKYDPAHPERLLPFWARWFARSGRGLAALYRLNDLRRGRRTLEHAPAPVPEDHPFSQLRKQAGLPHVTRFQPSLRAAICMWPDWFAAPQRDWPDEAVVTGFPFYPLPDRDASSSPARRGAEAPIVVTTGTAAGSQFAFYRTVVDACSSIGRPAILVSPHRNHIPAELPSDVTWVPQAPFGELFRKASIVVHHGGIGTAAYGMAAGVPQIVMPMRWDQFDNGNRLQRLGVARMLSPKETGAAALRHALMSMLQSRRIADRCRYWQSRVDVEYGVRKAVEAIESRC
jgi:rhamnosyltransferase subunit B